MAAAGDQTPADLGDFLTQLVAWARAHEPPDPAAMLAVGMRATLAALAYTDPDRIGRHEEAQAVVLLQMARIGWSMPHDR